MAVFHAVTVVTPTGFSRCATPKNVRLTCHRCPQCISAPGARLSLEPIRLLVSFAIVNKSRRSQINPLQLFCLSDFPSVSTRFCRLLVSPTFFLIPKACVSFGDGVKFQLREYGDTAGGFRCCCSSRFQHHGEVLHAPDLSPYPCSRAD